MLRNLLLAACLLNAFQLAGQAQQSASPQPDNSTKPEVKLNYLNVCTPNDKEREQIAAALNALLPAPKPSEDFEESRGRATEQAKVSWYLRLRRDFSERSSLATAQYTIREDPDHVTETLVLQPRESKAALQILLEDSITRGSAPVASLLDVNSPVIRIKVERFGAASVGLSRCEGTDQQAYEDIFRQATQVFGAYRNALSLKSMLDQDVHWLQEKADKEKTATNDVSSRPKKLTATGQVTR